MTTDRSMVANYIHDIRMGMLNDGTAIGDGLATSINRIKDGKAKSKSIILITDGVNNTGVVAPLTALRLQKKWVSRSTQSGWDGTEQRQRRNKTTSEVSIM